MAIRRVLVAGFAAVLVVLGAATVAQAATSKTITLSGAGATTVTGSVAVTGCPATGWNNASLDTAATSAGGSNGCSYVSVKIYYTNSHGYAGWTNSNSDSAYAQLTLSGGDELQKSSHTAVAKSTTAQ